MPIIAICGVLLVAGLALGGAWFGVEFAAAPVKLPAVELTAVEVARRFLWYSAILLTGGMIAGITVIGAGGRLAMRLLAVTAGDDAQGRITEAEETVGKITVDGTIVFILFNGIFGGVIAAALFLIVRRFLPDGRLGGIAFGAGLLVVLGTTVEPLRSENPDFDIVGPGWLAALVFSAMALAFGMVLSSVTARLSHWLPLPSTERRAVLRYVAPTLLAVVAFSGTAVLAVVCLATVAVTRWRPIVDAVRSRRFVVVGRIVVLVGVAVALPNAVRNLVDIGTR